MRDRTKKQTKTRPLDWIMIQWSRACDETFKPEVDELERALNVERDDRGRVAEPFSYLVARATKLLALFDAPTDKWLARVRRVKIFSTLVVVALGALAFPFARVDTILGNGVNLAGPFLFFLLTQIFFLSFALILAFLVVLMSVVRRLLGHERPVSFSEKAIQTLSSVVGSVAIWAFHRFTPVFYAFWGGSSSERFAWHNRSSAARQAKEKRPELAKKEERRKEETRRATALFWDVLFSQPRVVAFWGGALSHLFWASCSLCVLLILVARMQGNRYEYCWHTSLEDERVVKQGVDLLGTPVAALGIAVPNDDDVAALFTDVLTTNDSRSAVSGAPKAPPRQTAAETRAKWSYFLLAIVFVWCVAPRLVLVGVYYLLYRHALRDFKPRLSDDYFHAVIERADAYCSTTKSEVVPDREDDVVHETAPISAPTKLLWRSSAPIEKTTIRRQTARSHSSVVAEKSPVLQVFVEPSDVTSLEPLRVATHALDGKASEPRLAQQALPEVAVQNDSEGRTPDVDSEETVEADPSDDVVSVASSTMDAVERTERTVEADPIDGVVSVASLTMDAVERTERTVEADPIDGVVSVASSTTDAVERTERTVEAVPSDDVVSVASPTMDAVERTERTVEAVPIDDVVSGSVAEANGVSKKETFSSSLSAVTEPTPVELEERRLVAALASAGGLAESVFRYEPEAEGTTLAFGYDVRIETALVRELVGARCELINFGDAAEFDVKKKLKARLDSDGERVALCAIFTDVGLPPARHFVRFMRDTLVPALNDTARIVVVLSGGERMRRKFATSASAVSERIEDWTKTLSAMAKGSGKRIASVFYYDAELNLPEPRARLQALFSGKEELERMRERPRDLKKWDVASSLILEGCRKIFDAESFVTSDETDRLRIAQVSGEIFKIYRDELGKASYSGRRAFQASLGGEFVSRFSSTNLSEGLTRRVQDLGLTTDFIESRIMTAYGLSDRLRTLSSKLSPKCALAAASVGLSVPVVVAFAPLLGGAFTASALLTTLGAVGSALPASLTTGAVAGALGAFAPESLKRCKIKLVEKLSAKSRASSSLVSMDEATSTVDEQARAASSATLACSTVAWAVALELQGLSENAIVDALPNVLRSFEELPLDSPSSVEEALKEARRALETIPPV